MERKEPRSYRELIEKLDRFTRKYYLNKVIRGSLLFIGLLIFVFILLSTLEYNFYFDTTTRKVLFFSFIAIGAGSLYVWILKPLLSLFRLGNTISHQKAAAIIGTHFSDVKDKLLNVLQLRDQLSQDDDTSLLMASIDQKTARIKPVQFQRAIDLSKNKRYLKYALPPLFIFGALLLLAPSMISEGSSRIIKNNQYFEKPAPFHFQVAKADNLTAIQYTDYEILVDTDGDFVPEHAFIELGEQTYQLEGDDKHDFRFTIKNIKDDLSFKLTSGEVESQDYHVDVLKKPQFLDMKIRAYYPKYINRPSETFENNGDLTLPAGSQLTWTISAKETAAIQAKFTGKTNSALLPFEEKSEGSFEFKKGIYSNLPYVLYASSAELPLADSMHYHIEAIPDQYPTISVQFLEDSLTSDYRYFTGKADDDYGLKSLYLVYKIRNNAGIEGAEIKKSIKSVTGLFTSFDYLFTLDSFNLQDGDEIFYHFEVWDNDGIQGSKAAKTSVYNYKKASLDDLEQQEKQNNEDIKDALKNNLEKTKELKKEIKELKEKFLNKKELNWQDKKDAEKLLEKQEEIRKALEKAKKQLQENMKNQEKLSQVPEALQEKQKKLEELMDKVMDDELRELMEEIQKLLEEMQREESIDQMENMEMSTKEMELDMDKMVEMFKQLEMEQQLQQEIEKLNELGEEQEKLGEETEKGEKSAEELKEEQEKLTEAFDKIQEELKKLEEKNKELENPKNIEDTEDLEKEIDDEQKTSEEELEKKKEEEAKGNKDSGKEENEENGSEEEEEENNNEEEENEQSPSQDAQQKAAKLQKSAGQKMKKMAEQLETDMQSGQMDQMGEDIEMMRQLLENILTLSFEEEELISDFDQTSKETVKYVELVQNQFKIQDDFSLVRDSLHELSKRNESIESFIMDKVGDIDKNLEKSLKQLEERQKAKASTSQRFVMTFLNDLALMLSESMAQMQQQMASMMPGSQMCNKPKPGPGGGNKPMDRISQGQQEIKEGLQKMMKDMKDGNTPGSEDFGKMAQQQAAMRKMLRDMQQGNSERGKNDKLLQEIIDAMNGMEKDLVNKRLNNEMLKRQQDIETRLLEAEKAERQRDLDDQRESKTAEKVERRIPPAIEAYLKERQNQLRQVDRSSPLLTPYYKRLVDLYYKSLNN